MHSNELNARRWACEAILRTTGQAARARFIAGDFKTDLKGAQDFVSEVDRTTEHSIKHALQEHFPTDSFLGEESGGGLGDSTWIVDPIDGTSNFVRGTAYWCLSAALVVDGVPVIGVIYDPMMDEMFSCQAGKGATVNGRPMSVTKNSAPTDAVLGLSFNFQTKPTTVSRVIGDLLSNGTSFRMMGAGALSLAHCAAGRTDGFWEEFMKPWDAAAGLLLIAEAGGIVCDYGADDGYSKGNAVLGATPLLADYFSELTGVPLASSKAIAP